MRITDRTRPGVTSAPPPPPPPTSNANLDSGFYEYQPPAYPGYTGSLNTGSSSAGTPPPDSGQNGGMSDSSMGNSASS